MRFIARGGSAGASARVRVQQSLDASAPETASITASSSSFRALLVDGQPADGVSSASAAAGLDVSAARDERVPLQLCEISVDNFARSFDEYIGVQRQLQQSRSV